MKNYKIECVPIYDPSYVVHPFTVFFESEEYMFDFMEIVPNTYSTRHYERSRNEWHLIAEIDGWRVCGDGD
jgi:hypothetical protein